MSKGSYDHATCQPHSDSFHSRVLRLWRECPTSRHTHLHACDASQTEVRYLHSSILGEAVKIFVYLPGTYRFTDTTYPALYLTDANLSFAATTQIIGMMQIGRELPPLILVGLGYGTDSLNTIFKLRSRDLTPTPIPDPQKLGWLTGERQDSCDL